MVRDAHAEGKPVSICGEMAGDPAAAVLLMAMGFDSLSMNATNLPKVKWMLRQINLSKAKELLAELMTIDNPQVIHSSLQLALKNLGLARMINPPAATRPLSGCMRLLREELARRPEKLPHLDYSRFFAADPWERLSPRRGQSPAALKPDIHFPKCPPKRT